MSEHKNNIKLSDEELEFTHESQTLFKFRWCDVKEIVAFKEDCFCLDSICIGFRVSDKDEYCRVFEEAEGYKEMLSELERRFPDMRIDWFTKVAFPAFAPNWTTIWGTPFVRDLQ